MSGSDYDEVSESSKRHHRKKSKYIDDKPKKRKRSRSFERGSCERDIKEKKKQKSDDEFDRIEEREYKSRDKYPKKHSSLSGERNRERKKRRSPSVEELDYRKDKTHKSKNKIIGRDDEEIYVKEHENRGKDKRDEKKNIKSKDFDEKRSKKSTKKEGFEEKLDQSDKKSISKYEDNDVKKRKKSGSRNEKSEGSNDNISQSHRYDASNDTHDEEEDKDYFGSNKEVHPRYWSSHRPTRENSTTYWSKSNDRIQKSNANVEVGPRYYSTGDQARRDMRNKGNGRDKQEDSERRSDVKEENTLDDKVVEKNVAPKRTKAVDLLTTRTGGAYIPPARLRMMQESITDKGSAAYQRLAWEALKKSIQGHVNKVNVSNIKGVLKAIQKENIVRGKGLLCRALIQAQAASPTFTNVYAALAAVLNARFPKIGELLLKRLVVQFRRGFKRNDKTICITAATFIAHLVNQEVAHEILALEILTLLIETPTDDSVEVAIAFLKECGMKLSEVSNKGVMGIFDMLRNILHEGTLEKRVQYMIEVMFQIRKEDFKAHPSLIEDLDLVDQEDKITHLVSLEENHDPEDILNVFKFDPEYEAKEALYKSLVHDDDEDEDDDEDSGSGNSDDESDEEGGEEGEGEKKDVIVDKTETNLVALRKTIYLTIQSSLDFEECAHKLLKMELKPGQEIEMAHMFLDCCAEQRTYEKFFGLLSQRFCQINRSYIAPFEETFRDSYTTIHRMSNDKLRNIAKLFAHLLYTDAISWDVLAIIRLNEEDTTSSSRIFIKILFQELSEYMGLANLNQRVKDPSLQTALEGLFPRDNPKNTRFAINFFTSIGLGGITDELREHLKSMPKETAVVPQLVEDLSSSSDSSSSDSSSDSSSSSSDSSSDSSSSDSEDTSRKKKNKKKLASKKKKEPPPKKSEKIKNQRSKATSVSKRKRERS